MVHSSERIGITIEPNKKKPLLELPDVNNNLFGADNGVTELSTSRKTVRKPLLDLPHIELAKQVGVLFI